MCISAFPCRLHFPFLYWKTFYVTGWRVQFGSAYKKGDLHVLRYPQSSVFPWGRATIHAFGSVLLASYIKWYHYYLYCKFSPVHHIEIRGEYTYHSYKGINFCQTGHSTGLHGNSTYSILPKFEIQAFQDTNVLAQQAPSKGGPAKNLYITLEIWLSCRVT